MNLPRSKEVSEAVEASRATIARVNAPPLSRTVYRARRREKRLKRFMVALFAGLIGLFVASTVFALVIEPLGILGLAFTVMLALLVVMGAGLFAREGQEHAHAIGNASAMPEVAERADRFLAQNRRALPAPAQDLSDLIARRLAAMAPQMEVLEVATPEGQELRRLLGEELPELVTHYTRVPAHLRREDRNGRVPETELIDGLKLVDGKLDAMARQLAATDMDRLSAQKRYLELRYEGDVQPSA